MKTSITTSLLLLLFTSGLFAKTITLSEDNTITFNKPFRKDYVAKVQGKLLKMALERNASEPIYIVLNTPGGSVDAGNDLIEMIEGLNIPVHTITISAASMGYILAQHSTKRYILSTGTLMSHRMSIAGLSGQINGEANARVQYFTDLSDKMSRHIANRVGMSLKSYKKLIKDEFWTVGEEAVKQNHADEVVKVRCDSSLLGYTRQKFNTMFGSVSLKTHKCPLITGAIRAKGNKKAVSRLKQYLNNRLDFIEEPL